MESLKFYPDRRNTLYFGKYRYRIKCKVVGASWTYYTRDIEEFKKKMISRQKRGFIHDYLNTDFSKIDYDQIEKFLEYRYSKNADYITRIEHNNVSFFTNDPSLAERLKKLDEKLSGTEVNLFGEKDVKYFKKEPKFKYRTYFKGKRAPDSFKTDVLTFIENYDVDNGKTTAKVCQPLKHLVGTGSLNYYNYINNSYYIDYNDESTLTLLHMIFGSMIAKTYSLKKEPENR